MATGLVSQGGYTAVKPGDEASEAGDIEEGAATDPSGPENDTTRVQKHGIPSQATIISVLDACAVAATLLLAAFALLVIYVKRIAVYLGFKYQFVIFGLVLSGQGLCTSRQVLLCAVRLLIGNGNAHLQDVEAILRNSMFTKNARWTVVATLVTLTALGPLLSALYKPFFLIYSSERISSITDTFAVGPPPELDNLNGVGTALAVSRMTPFWQARPRRPATDARMYGENMLVMNESLTVMLDAPSLATFTRLRTKLDTNTDKNQSLDLSADVNATVAHNVDISDTERRDFGEIFDDVEASCNTSSFNWCIGMGGGWYAGMVLGGVQPSKFLPAESSSVNYLGIWNRHKEKFSQVVQKFVLTRQFAHGTWEIRSTTFTLTNASLIDNKDRLSSQAPLTTRPLGLDLFGQLFEEYNYRAYDFDFQRSPTTFMASIVWARLTTLRIEDRENKSPWFKHVLYNKSADEPSYTLELKDRTVSQSPLLVLIFLVHPVVTITATLLKAWLHTVPVSDAFGLVSMLSSLSHQHSAILDGAGFSGTLDQKILVWFDVEEGIKGDHDRIKACIEPEPDSGKVRHELSTQIKTGKMYN
ncbi:MAG: hypothetical protein Q9165_001305 [Trypethelium subeluteriae]